MPTQSRSPKSKNIGLEKNMKIRERESVVQKVNL